MQEHDEARTVNRRRLLRRAGTVAAGAAGVTVAGAMVSSPAQAAAGDAVLAGQANTSGTATTTLTGGDATHPTLRLENASGAALSVTNTDVDINAPAGSVFVDSWGDFSSITEDGGQKYLTMAYSPTWATMTIPTPMFRLVDTRNSAGREFIVPGSASYDSAGRVLPKGSATVPDMVIDLSAIFSSSTGLTAVQANLTIINPTGQGYAALWDEGPWPSTSSINYGVVAGLPAIANFTQTVVGSDLRIRFKTNRAAAVLLDIAGFIVSDPYTELGGQGIAAAGLKAAKSGGPQRRRAREI
jgi:hypothetical protein